MSKHFTPQELVEGFSQLYTLPSVYFRVKTVVETSDARTEDLVRELAIDPALTARVLRLVNSPLYAMAGKVETLLRAVHVLGHRAIHDLVLATSVTAMIARRSIGEFDMQDHWRRSLLIGLITRAIGARLKLMDRERLFVEGLLSRLGLVVMHERIGAVAAVVTRHASSKGLPLQQSQLGFLGCHFGEVGAALLRKWKLPESISNAVQHHLNPAEPGEAGDVSTLRLAASLANALESSGTEQSLQLQLEEFGPNPALSLSLSPEQLSAVLQEASEELDQVQLALTANAASAA